MNKSTAYEYEANRNSDGEFICDSYTEIKADTNKQQSTQQSTQQQQPPHQPNEQPYNQNQNQSYSTMADEIFRQSYSSNFLAEQVDYVETMRSQFDHMRQSMLDQMESFTFIRNIKK